MPVVCLSPYSYEAEIYQMRKARPTYVTWALHQAGAGRGGARPSTPGLFRARPAERKCPSSHSPLRGSPLQAPETPTVRGNGPPLPLNTCNSAVTNSKCPFKVPITKGGVPLVGHSPVSFRLMPGARVAGPPAGDLTLPPLQG